MYYVSQLLNGLGIGSIYALIALGYSMVYGVVKLINFAHGDIIMVGSYTIFVLLSFNAPVWLAIVGSILFCALMGILIERVAYRRLLAHGSPRITLLITAIAVSIFLQNLYQMIFGSRAQSLQKLFVLPEVYIGQIPVSTTILNVAVAILMMVLLEVIVNRTKIGHAMRATSEDADAAKLMGINTTKVILFTFALGSALAAVGSVLYANKYMQINPTMGGMLGIKAFVSAVLGGISSMPGAMLGAMLLGLAESMTIAFGGSLYVDAVVFVLLIIILLIKPSGLLGKHMKEKV